jgi:flagellar basal-body rod protein FlgF
VAQGRARRQRRRRRLDATAGVQTEALEGSNVSPVESMVAMISAARQFEQQMKMLQSAQEREQSATRLLGTS